jgi:hypothetical protein
MTDVREHGLHVLRELLPGGLPDDDAGLPAASTACGIAREVHDPDS